MDLLTDGIPESISASEALHTLKSYMYQLAATLPELQGEHTIPDIYFPENKSQQQEFARVKTLLDTPCQTEEQANKTLFELWSQYGEISSAAECE